MDKIFKILFDISEDSYDMTGIAVYLALLVVLFVICVVVTQRMQNEHIHKNTVKRGTLKK